MKLVALEVDGVVTLLEHILYILVEFSVFLGGLSKDLSNGLVLLESYKHFLVDHICFVKFQKVNVLVDVVVVVLWLHLEVLPGGLL